MLLNYGLQVVCAAITDFYVVFVEDFVVPYTVSHYPFFIRNFLACLHVLINSVLLFRDARSL